MFRGLDGDLIFLGVAGKMGPTLARMAKRASDAAGTKRRIVGVSRFSSEAEMHKLHAHGIETIRCDLLDEVAVAKLPDAPNVVYLAGMKFGATSNASLTWAMNAWLPAIVCKKFARSRIAAFSTGNVYGLMPVARGGSRETDAPNPVGEYAMSCLGRERMFEHFSRTAGAPVATIRLIYACELRYGVLVDIAQRVWSGEPIDVDMGWLNTIWQGDANAMSLLTLAYTASPPFVINVAGPEIVSVREAAEKFARGMNKPVSFAGSESPTALLGSAHRAVELFGKPRVSVDQMIAWIADWIARGGATLGKLTHFENREGKF
jgi:nucleoside-diphosphate-sugar epimerase